MPVYNTVVSLLVCFLAIITFSCESLKDIVGSPSLSMKSVAIKSLDLEGITFSVDYSISNPYPIAFSIKEVAANITYEDTTLTKLSTSKGVNVVSMGSASNTMTFKVPYETIIKFAKAATTDSSNKSESKKSLPFMVSGTASLDLSAIAFLENQTMTLPFKKSFEVPVFKPSFSISDVKLQMPDVASLKNAFTSSGMNILKAASAATAILSGKPVSADAFDGVNIDFGLNFNVNVANEGSSAWDYIVNSCSLTSSAGKLADVAPTGTNSISSSNGTIPMTAKLNTLTASAFIVQLINKSGKNPVFSLDSGISFPDLPYAQKFPLAYSCELPLSKVSK